MIDHFILWAGVGEWGILFVLMAMIFLLGFFFDWIEITLIVLPVFGPIVAELTFGDHLAGYEAVGPVALIWFTILVSVNLQTSFLTPPFGFALFYMKGVAPPFSTFTEASFPSCCYSCLALPCAWPSRPSSSDCLQPSRVRRGIRSPVGTYSQARLHFTVPYGA